MIDVLGKGLSVSFVFDDLEVNSILFVFKLELVSINLVGTVLFLVCFLNIFLNKLLHFENVQISTEMHVIAINV